MSDAILQVRNLASAFQTESGLIRAVDSVSFEVHAGRTLGLVGESGCGKSVTAFSITRLLPQPSGRIVAGQILYAGRDMASLAESDMRKIRGKEISMIFQEPMSALNPVYRIGRQIAEVYHLHEKLSKREALTQSIEMLKKVGIPSPELRSMDFPHQLSGGMRQRVMIAMALALKPKLLIADEPTTALDVTVQAQILELMSGLQKEAGMAMMLITHDLGVIAQNCHDVAVMYAGRIVEKAPVRELYSTPRHAYTKGLLASIPSLESVPKSRLRTIEGSVPAIHEMPPGCRFCTRNGASADAPTVRERPPFMEISPGHWVENCPRCVGGEN